MRYKKTFSLLEFYEELNFIELEELYTLWKLFPKQSVSYQFELFFSFKKAHQEKYNCVLDVLRKKLSNSFAIFSEILLEYHNYKKFCEISNIKETHKVSLDSMFYRLQIDSLQKQIYSHIDELISYYRGVYKTLSVSTGLFKDYSESDYLESSLIILLFDLLSNYKNVRNKFSFNLKK